MMKRELRFKPVADEQLSLLEKDPTCRGILKQVRKTLAYLETDLHTPSLQTHEYKSLTKRYGRKIFEAYVQQSTPGAYRVFWYYGDDEIDRTAKGYR
jgi:hypothetical protein